MTYVSTFQKFTDYMIENMPRCYSWLVYVMLLQTALHQCLKKTESVTMAGKNKKEIVKKVESGFNNCLSSWEVGFINESPKCVREKIGLWCQQDSHLAEFHMVFLISSTAVGSHCSPVALHGSPANLEASNFPKELDRKREDGGGVMMLSCFSMSCSKFPSFQNWC